MRYFRPGTFHEHAMLDDMKNDWYSACLSDCGEPVLAGDGGDTSIVRLTVLPSFSEARACRVTEAGERVTLDAHDGTSRAASRSISASEWNQLRGLAAAAGLWELPTQGGANGLDGEIWLIELVERGRHHVIDRWSPEPGAYRDVGLALGRLAGWDLGR